jgi:hypothetical protein
MQITALNSTEELKSFPINQSIRLKFEKAVEDSLLESRLSLIRLPNQTGLFNISETYNQSIGYIREKFDIEETTITSELVDGSFIVVVKPVKPLSPGFEYVLFIDKTLSEEYLSISKTVSKSNSNISVDLSNNISPTELQIEIISEPFISSTNNIVKILLKDLVGSTSKQYTLDLKKTTKLVYGDLTVNFISQVYVLGEKFNILSIGGTELPSNFYLKLKASITESIKPIESDAEFGSISNKDLYDFFNKQSNNDNLTLTTTIVNNGKIRIKLPDNITTSDLDFDNLTHSYEEAFNMYTLNLLELYDDSKVYEIVHNIEDEKTFTLTVKEVV